MAYFLMEKPYLKYIIQSILGRWGSGNQFFNLPEKSTLKQKTDQLVSKTKSHGQPS